MNEKKSSRLRRARRSRMKMRELGTVRLSVNRTPRHIYAQVIAADGSEILAQASTLEADLRGGATGNVATQKGRQLIAERAKKAGVTTGVVLGSVPRSSKSVSRCSTRRRIGF